MGTVTPDGRGAVGDSSAVLRVGKAGDCPRALTRRGSPSFHHDYRELDAPATGLRIAHHEKFQE
jgi:hypothetical protein